MKEIRIARSKGAAQANKMLAEFSLSPDEGYKDIRIPSASALISEDVPGTQPEPIFDSAVQADIQGNVIPGFNKDHQAFLFFQFSGVKDCRTFLRWLVPHLSSMEEVVAFRKVFRALRFKHGRQYSNCIQSRVIQVIRTPTQRPIFWRRFVPTLPIYAK